MTAVTLGIEPAGWGEPGSVRHAEAIGHGVWLAEHPKVSLHKKTWLRNDMDPTPVADLEAWHGDHDPVRSAAVDDLLDEVFGKPKPKCPVARCVLDEHDARWLQHIDAQGNGWYPGEAPR